MKRVILFDIDGTLLVSRGIGREAKRRAMLECFGTTGDLDSHAFGGKTDWGILADLLAPHGYTKADIGHEMSQYETVMARHMRAISPAYTAEPTAHAQELLGALRQRPDTLIGLVTGNTSKTAVIKLEMAGFDPASFVVGAFGNESHERADLTRLARQRAGDHLGCQLNGSAFIVIGDTPADIEAARAIDAIAVAVCTGYAERASLIDSRPDFLLDDLGSFQRHVLL